MTLADYQISFNGLTMGPNTPYRLRGLQGFRGLPTIGTSDLPRQGVDGTFAGRDTNVERILQAVAIVTGTSGSDFETNLAALEAAMITIPDGADLKPLAHKLPNRSVTRRYNARPRKHDEPLDPTYIRSHTTVALQWECPDPTIYDDTSTTSAIATTGTITNAGNWPSRPVITVTPSATTVTIVNTDDSSNQIVLKQWVDSGSVTHTIPASVVIDCWAGTVVDGSAVNRFDVVDSTSTPGFFALVAGVNHLSITGGSMSVVWRSAWIN